MIAEIGVNHEGDLERAKRLIADAAAGGASSVKFQFYKASKLTSADAPAYWDLTEENTGGQKALFQKYDKFEPEDFEKLGNVARNEGVLFGLSVFHPEGITETSEFVDFFKVASGDITYHALIETIVNSGKPTVLSTGASSAPEIHEAYELVERLGPGKIAFLQCTLSYPTPLAAANVGSLKSIREITPNSLIGISDHISEKNPARFQIAYALGARVFEKHFSDTPGNKGNDHYHSFGKKDLRGLVNALEVAKEILGDGEILLPIELAAREGARRSLFYDKDLESGTIITADFLTALRPGNGEAPSQIGNFLGRVLTENVKKGELLSKSNFMSKGTIG